MIKIPLFFLAVFFLAVPLFSAEEPPPSKTDYILLPLPIYAVETGIEFTLTGAMLYNKIPDTYTSMLKLQGSYTQKNQSTLTAELKNFWPNNEYALLGMVTFWKYPDIFYGTGNSTLAENADNHTYEFLKAPFEFDKRWPGNFLTGVKVNFEHYTLLACEENGLLSGGNYTGSKGGGFLGFGAVVSYDTRDNTYYAKQGLFASASAMKYAPVQSGTDGNYFEFKIDAREYFSSNSIHTLALQQYFGVISGTPPVQMLQLFGGPDMMRGYYLGRYRDKGMALIQAEYRVMPWEYIGFSLFGSAGDVGHDFSSVNVKFAGGAGLRIALVPAERMNIRIDYALSGSGSGLYVRSMEAF